MTGTDDRHRLLVRIHELLDRAERLLPAAPPAPDFDAHAAWRWQGGIKGAPVPVTLPDLIDLNDLIGIDRQKQRLTRNTRQFMAGLPSNNALLTGSRGSGKSSLVKAMLNTYAGDGLRMIELSRDQLEGLPSLVEQLSGSPHRFIVYCDDLAFGPMETGYQHLKAVLEGSLSASPDNVLLYATSNRRHLMPEYHHENQETTRVGEEIHPGESVEEKVSLSERFGLWLSFPPVDQDGYLALVRHWLRRLGGESSAEAETAALRWSLERGGRSARVASQFARDWIGRQALGSGDPQL